MPRQFWVTTNRGIEGGFSAPQLKQLAAKGKLKPNHHVSADRKTWIRAAEVKGLRFAGKEQAATSPPSLDDEEVLQWIGPAQESSQRDGGSPQSVGTESAVPGPGPISTWCDLLKQLQKLPEDQLDLNAKDLFHNPLFAKFPHQILFAFVQGNLGDPSYFDRFFRIGCDRFLGVWVGA